MSEGDAKVSEYELERNSFIPAAVRYADSLVDHGDYTSDQDYYDNWNREYHARMNWLWRTRLRS